MAYADLTVAWISDFPIEWLPDIPEPLQILPRQHPATWQIVLLNEFEKLPSLRLHIIVLRKGIQQDYHFERNRVAFHVLKYAGGLRAPSFFWTDTRLIGRELKKIKPDLVHAWGSERGAALAASRLPFPFLVTIQGLLSWYQEIVPISLPEKLSVWAEKTSLRRSTVVTTESNFAVDYLRKKHPHLKTHQIEHAPNWLFHAVERKPQTNPVRFITVGTFGFRKGSDLLLKALDAITPTIPFQIVIVGSPNETFVAPLKKHLSCELWNRITFKTNLKPAEIAHELSQATMALLPTRADTSPNAVKEAVVAGVPVIASRVGGIPDYVRHGENGFLFESGDLSGFVNVIKQACAHPFFGKGLVHADSLKRNREYLSPATMAKNFWAAYLDRTGHKL